MTKALTTFVNDDRGVDLIEYALLAGLIGVAAITAITGIGTQVSRILGAVSAKMVTVTVP
jgi:pilus assembly protein Flp/PilA